MALIVYSPLMTLSKLLPVQIDLHGAEDAEAIKDQTNNQDYDLLVIDTLAMSIGEGTGHRLLGTPHLAEGEVCPQTIPQSLQLRLS